MPINHNQSEQLLETYGMDEIDWNLYIFIKDFLLKIEKKNKKLKL